MFQRKQRRNKRSGTKKHNVAISRAEETVNVEYDVEYLPDKDGVHQAKATITKAEPSGDLVSRADAIEVGNKIVEELSSSSIYWDDLKHWVKELFDALPSADPKGANLINRHDATTVIREECLKCNNLTNADLLGRILALPTSQQTDCTDFIMWLIEVVLDDEDWELNAVAYGETIARKLKKLGLLEVKDGYYIRHIENNTKESDLVYRPSADRPKGEWVKYKRCDPVGDEIYAIMEAPDGKFFCNRCGKYAIKSDYCPNCGADMRGEDDG